MSEFGGMFKPTFLVLTLLAFGSNVTTELFEYGESGFPDGPYSLLVPATGCVEDETRHWGPGYILFKSLVNNPSHVITKGAPNWLGSGESTSFLLSFCTKLDGKNDNGTVQWPMGHYGVFKAGEKCPPGFVERSNHFQIPEFQTWESEGELPDIDLFQNVSSMKITTCIKETSSDGTNSTHFAKAVYLLKDPEFDCPMFDGYEVTEERLFLECVLGDDCVNFTMCHVKPNITTLVPMYDLDEWNDLGMVATCLEALGMADGTITDDQLSASSLFLRWTPNLARPGKLGWIPELEFTENDWLQIDVGTVVIIEGIEVQYVNFSSGGAANLSSGTEEQTDKYWIKYAMAQRNLRPYNGKLLIVRRMEVVLLIVQPFAARFVRIEMKALFTYGPIRFELFGCKRGAKIDFHDWIESVLPTMCFDKLGMIDGTIFDFQITGSSWIPEYEPTLARPGMSGWCADLDDPNPYIEIDFIVPTYVQGLVIHDMSSIVSPVQHLCNVSSEVIQHTTIFVSFAKEPPVFKPYRSQPFNVSTVKTTELLFLRRFLAKSVRVEIIKVSTEKPSCLLFEIIGCRFEDSVSTHCDVDTASSWIDDPIILPSKSPRFQPDSILNITSLESCQELCLNKTEHRCSTVQFSHGNNCTIYPRGDWFLGNVISPSSNTDMWRTRVCLEERTRVRTFRLSFWYLSVIVSSGYPIIYAPEIRQKWTILGSWWTAYAVEMLFTNISLYPPTTEDCEDKIVIWGGLQELKFPEITHEYNGAVLFVPCLGSTINVKLMTCPRPYGEQRYYGFRAMLSDYFYYKVTWPRTSASSIWKRTDSVAMHTFSLLGHPLHTLTKDIWKVHVTLYSSVLVWYYNVPCSKGHHLTVVFNTDRQRYCGNNRPAWNFKTGVITIEYSYGEPVFAAGFSASIDETGSRLSRLDSIGYKRPDSIEPCHVANMGCNRTVNNVTSIYCALETEICDGVRHCANNEDESDYGCNQFIPSACSKDADRCHFLKDYVNYNNESYLARRNYNTTDCSDLDGRYTLPIIHNEQQMTSLRMLIGSICVRSDGPACSETVFLDIGLRRYHTDDGIEELWEDGTKVSFTAWGGRRTPSLLCTSLAFENLVSDNYYWVYRSCDKSLSSVVVICEQPYKQQQQGVIRNSSGSAGSNALLFSSRRCTSGEVIFMAAHCDGIADCYDGSDETNCETYSGEECTFEEFACGNGTCIGLHNVCDYKQDCYPDGDDELCEFPDCEANEFTCDNKQCIPSYSRCDAVKDCIDGSDEKLCESCNSTTSFSCEDLTCIHKAFVCDGINTCKYGRDESICEKQYSTCFQLWQAGYRDGTYLLDDTLRVQCTFTVNGDFTINTTTEMDLDVYVHDTGLIANISSLSPYVTITVEYQDRLGLDDEPVYTYKASEDSLCEMKIEVGCTPNIAKMKDFDEIGPYDIHRLCGEQTMDIRFDWSRPVAISVNDSEGITSAIKQSEERPDILIIQPKRNIAIYSTVTVGKLVCSKEYMDKESVVGCEDGTVAPLNTQCIYDIGRAGNPIGCPSFVHLENCDEAKCPSAEYVKCPGDFCIPERFVCDGIKHCRDGADELDCGCGERDDQVTIVYSGDASEVERSYIYKFGRLLLSSGSDVRVVSLGIRERNVLVRLRTIHHSNEAMNINKWQTHTIPLLNITDFIVASESVSHTIIVIHDDSILDDIDFNNDQISFLEQRALRMHVYAFYMKSDMRLSAMKSEEENRTSIFVKTWDILGSYGSPLIEKCQGNKTDRCAGKFKCMSSMVCIPLRQVCDGITQCIFGDDERLCDFFCPVNCSCGNNAITCSAKTLNTTYLHTLPTSVRSLDLSFSQGIFDNDTVFFPYTLSVLVRLNISSCSIADIADGAYEKTKNLLYLDLSYNRLKYITRTMFKGLTKLRELLMTGNTQLESLERHAFQNLVSINSLKIVDTQLFEIVPETFDGLRLSALDISSNRIRKIYDMAFSGLDVITLKMDGNDISDFSRDIFTDMRNVRTIISPAFKFCCYRPDYVEGKNCFPAEDEFSSCEDLMRNSGLQTLLWVVGVSALVGNCLSIVYRLTIDKVRLKLGFGIFVTNLAISDLLMGVYLLIIAVADLTFRNRYIEVEAEWRTSNFCKLAGVLATVSSEASVVFMVLITLDRILVIKFPFGKLRFRTNSALVFSTAGWVLAWGIALFPLFNSKSFDGQFYSKSGVCLALPLTRDRAPGWLYSVLIFVGLNFVTFILIAFGQLIIYLEIKKNSKRMKKMAPTKQSISRRNDMIVARNVFLVLTTDFLCWFPIGVMAIRALEGHPISGDVYAWTAVTVLPINAALNPILYTVTAILKRKQFNPRPEEQDARTVDQTSLKKLLLSRYILRSTGEDLTSVATLLSDEQWKPRPVTILLLARSIVKMLRKMHECDIIHGQLNEDTVLIANKRQPKMFMNVTPRACKTDAEKRKDVNDFGQLLHRMMK